MPKIQQFELQPNFEYIKIHGLQRSGTNFIAKLIDDNFIQCKSLINAGGWKHGPYCAPWTLGQEVHVVVIVKNPYSWLTSMYRYWGPHKTKPIGMDLRGANFSDFVQNRVVFEDGPGVPVLFRASNPVQYWNNMNFHWSSIQMNQKSLFVFQYEQILKQPEQFLRYLELQCLLKRTPKTEVCKKILEPSEENVKTGTEDFDSSYYTDKKYMSEFTPELLDFVNHQLDADLMEHLGYRKESL